MYPAASPVRLSTASDDFEAAFKAHPEKKDVRFRDEHSQILDESDIPRFGQQKVIASMQPYHAADDGRGLVNRRDSNCR